MFSTLMGAVEIADIIVYVVLGLGLLCGLFGGLARAFKGIFAAGSIILISLLLVGVTIAPIAGTSIGQSLSGALKGTIEGWGDGFTADVSIAYDEKGEPIMDGDRFAYCVDIDGKSVMLDQAFGDGALNKVKAKVAVLLARRYVTLVNSGVPLAGYAAEALTTLILDIILFIVYCIVLGIVFALLRKVINKIFDGVSAGRKDSNWGYGDSGRRSGTVALVDRLLGAIVATGLALLTLLLVFAIIKAAAPAGSAVAQFFEKEGLAGTLYAKNPMFDMLGKLF